MIRRPRSPLIVATSAALVGVLASTAAQAAPKTFAKDRRFRIHADTEFFGFTHLADAGPGPDAPPVNVVGFGIGRPTLGDGGTCVAGSFGCALAVRPLFGFGFGYLFPGQRALLGARMSIVVDGVFGDGDARSTYVAGQFVPYFRWIFLPGRMVRPYVEGRFGLGGGSIVDHNVGMLDSASTGVIYPRVGVGGGVHIFVIDAFSVDLGLNADYFAPHGRTTVNPRPDPAPADYGEWQALAHVVNIAALAGFSVWLP